MSESPPNMVPMHVEQQLGDINLSLRFKVPNSALRPLSMLSLMRAVDERLIADVSARVIAGGETISCSAGCDACCHYLVPVSPIEARRLAEVVAAMPDERRAVVEARFLALADRLRAAGLYDRLTNPSAMSSAELDAVGDEYFSMKLPCPFLEDRRCSIYAERPMPCREFLVVTPAERCSEVGNPTVKRVRLAAQPSIASAAVEDFGLFEEGRWVLLAMALDWTARNPEPAPTATGPELVARFFDALELTVAPRAAS